MHLPDPDDLPPTMPEELREYMQRQYDKQQMQSEVVMNDIHQLMEGISDDQLATLNTIMSAIAMNGKTMAHFYAGMIVTEARRRKNAEAGVTVLTVSLDTEPDPPTTHPAKRYLNDCVTYNVTPDPKVGSRKVICNGCGQESVSLEDRMLRSPGVDGCIGCQEKGGWG